MSIASIKPALLLRLTSPNTVHRLERAARSRLDDVRQLHSTGQTFWALYTHGYALEIILKVAFLRLCGLTAGDDFGEYLRLAKSWADQVGVAHRARNLHDLLFWTELVIREREFAGRPLDQVFSLQLMARVQQVAKHWREDLRYWPALRVEAEALEVSAAVAWIVQRRGALWS